jgi:hypothetical protein
MVIFLDIVNPLAGSKIQTRTSATIAPDGPGSEARHRAWLKASLTYGQKPYGQNPV